jgi:hypothetical protein
MLITAAIVVAPLAPGVPLDPLGPFFVPVLP